MDALNDDKCSKIVPLKKTKQLVEQNAHNPLGQIFPAVEQNMKKRRKTQERDRSAVVVCTSKKEMHTQIIEASKRLIN